MAELQEVYNAEFNQIDFFDFSTLDLEDKLFSDLVHLKKEGAIYFSEFLEKGNWEDFKYN